MTVYAAPGTPDAKVTFKPRYEHWIGGEWVKPVKGNYFEDISPINGKPFAEVARGTAEDIDAALDAAHKAAPAWGKTSTTERAAVLNKIADVIEANLELLAVAETWDNGKPIREPLNADLPLAADHFRYFAAAIRAQEGYFAEMDGDMTAYHYHEPLGVVGQIIPWNFPILMAVWKLAPALAAGNAIVLKPAEQTPVSILVLVELIGDILPPGVLNIVNGFGVEAGKPLASSPRIRKIAFTGETTTGRLILQYASANIIPSTVELGGKSPNVFFKDVADADDAFYDKALEGFTLFAFNQGEVCTCPSRALIEKPIYDSFLSAGIERAAKAVQATRSTPTPRSGRRLRTTSSRRSSATWISASKRAQSCFSEGNGPTSVATCPRGITCRRRSSKATTRCVFSRKRSSVPSSLSRASTATTTPSRSPMTRSTGSARACGRATETPPTVRDATSRPAASG